MMQAIYSEMQIKPLRDELTNAGFSQITEVDAVEETINTKGFVIYVINSVCCCAANNARPAAVQALDMAKTKGLDVKGITSFAGVDIQAVNKFRELTSDYQPSSPCIGLFKDGRLLTVVERKNIEKSTVPEVLSRITPFFDK
ncbi:MAG: BrxA/BrxB family bacilliredoxin [Solitalea-like symbiont of Tyrophagus putrescentiae]